MAREQRTRPTRTGNSLKDSAFPDGLVARQMTFLGRSSAQCAFAAALLSLLFVNQQVGPPSRITLVVDSISHETVTAQRTVAAVLQEIGLDPEDGVRVKPAPDETIVPGLRVLVQRYRPVVLTLPDRTLVYRGMALTPGEVLADLGVVLGPRDLLRADRQVLSPESDLGPLRTADLARATRLVASSPLRIEGVRAAGNPLRFDALEPAHLVLERALPIMVHERGQTVALAVRGATMRDALAEAGVPILPGDLVRPDPSVVPQAGMQVYLERAKDLVLVADGAERTLRSRAHRVEELLQQQGITLGPLDQVTPLPAAPMRDGIRVQVVRVREEQVVEEETVPFVRQRVPTTALSLGEKRMTQTGNPGLLRYFYRVRFEDGEEVVRELTARQTARETRTEVIEFGTRAPTVVTPEGPKEYTRTMQVLATWYNASHGGKPKSSPGYGLTSLGLRATYGVMAVDPRVIPYWTKAYVPGYGIAVAADTGGGIKGNQIDLAFDEGAPVNWGTRYTDIYLLGSPTLEDALRAAFPGE